MVRIVVVEIRLGGQVKFGGPPNRMTVCYGTGCIRGTVGAVGATRVLESLLFGVAATDLTTFLTVAGVILASAVLATVIPARRAAAVDPMRMLRTE